MGLGWGWGFWFVFLLPSVHNLYFFASFASCYLRVSGYWISDEAIIFILELCSPWLCFGGKPVLASDCAFIVALSSRSLQQQGFSNKRLKPEYSRGVQQRVPLSGRFPKNTSAMPWTMYKDLHLCLYINPIEILTYMGTSAAVICEANWDLYYESLSCCFSSTISSMYAHNRSKCLDR